VVFYLVDLLQDKNKEVRRVADQCLDVIMDTDEEWAVRIRNLKFESFNQEWLDVVSTPAGQVRACLCVCVCVRLLQDPSECQRDWSISFTFDVKFRRWCHI
jgi:hypothetical protein